jgi:hypothetical protein
MSESYSLGDLVVVSVGSGTRMAIVVGDFKHRGTLVRRWIDRHERWSSRATRERIVSRPIVSEKTKKALVAWSLLTSGGARC